MKNIYFPCILIEHEDYYSIITSDFHLFDSYFEKQNIEAGGYTIEKLAKKLLKDKYNSTNGINFDSEAGMFCAYADDKELLLKLCALFREITGTEELHRTENSETAISKSEAERLLFNGFVYDLNIDSQIDFLEKVPLPALSVKQKEYINALGDGTDEAKLLACKRINSEARTRTRNLDSYLAHPKIISIFLSAIDTNSNLKVYQELLWALVFICDRHMPDLRAREYFYKALENKDATNRWLGLLGLKTMSEFSFEPVYRLENDKSKKVKDKALELLRSDNKRKFPSWMFT